MQSHSAPDSPGRRNPESQRKHHKQSIPFHTESNLRPVAPSYGKTLDTIFAEYQGISFAVRFWDGTAWQSSVDTPMFEVVLNTADAWNTLTSRPDEAALGEAYINGAIEVRGSLYLALRSLPQVEGSIIRGIPSTALRLHEGLVVLKGQLGRFFKFGTLHSQGRDSAAISYHYDKPPEFYRLWLGPSMVYSCAYFRENQEDVTDAQLDKMELICRKLGMKPHDRFLDIGCGWGSLVLHATRDFGVSAHGISLSKEQVAFAQQRIQASGKESACQVYLKDYRELRDVAVKFDKVASVGMCEHVGRKNIGSYFSDVFHMMVDGGLFLNHGITSSMHARKKQTSFIDRYVFPDGELLTLSEMVRAAEAAGFEVRDIEDLREHYEETLHCWVSELQDCKDQVIALTNAQTYRIWELYMTGSAEAFRRGDIAVYQMLLSKNVRGRSSATKTREEWYRPSSV